MTTKCKDAAVQRIIPAAIVNQGDMTRVVKAETDDCESQRGELENVIQTLGDGSKFLWIVLALTITPTLFNGLHATSYVFLAEVPTHWCAVSELSATNWTAEQIRNVSSATSCTAYSYDYSYLATLSFDDAFAYAEANRNVATEKCTKFSYADDIDGTSIVVKWDLVCDRTALRSSVQMAMALGKFFGSTFFGVIADRFGRRYSFITGVSMLIVFGPLSAFAPWYWLFMILRGLIGLSVSAMYISSFTILAEVAGPRHRGWMGIIHSMGYPVGTMILPGIAYVTKDWQLLQLSITLPAVLLLLHCWFMPESPRWLVSRDRFAEARSVMEKFCGPLHKVNGEPMATGKHTRFDREYAAEASTSSLSLEKESFRAKFDKLMVIYTNSELRKRILIAYVAWATCSLSYYTIALNVDNFSANRYLYIFLTGLSELPSYIVPGPLLAIMGRRLITFLLLVIGGVALLSILMIPETSTIAIMTVALSGRFAIAAAYMIIIIRTSELFPTVVRNTAVGTSSTASNIGGLSASYVVDLLGAQAWWAPSTMCGVAVLAVGSLSLVLPETRGRSLANTVEQELANERGTVSLRNCCSCA